MVMRGEGDIMFLNVLKELDSPGEWYLDRKTGNLFFWPPDSSTDAKPMLSIIDTIVSMHYVSNVTFEGIKLEVCRGNGIEIIAGRNDLITNCIIRDTGDIGAEINYGENNGIKRSEIYNTGTQGITLVGGNRYTLSPGNDFITDCRIHDFSQWVQTGRPGILISGVGNTISHNSIFNAPHTAIWLYGNNNVIKYNDIYSVCRETDDAGAFYMGRDWSMRGNIIYYNYFHNIHGIGAQGARAVYLDDFASGTTVRKNIFSDVDYGVLIGGGRDNNVQNNVFINCSRAAVEVDDRGETWAKNAVSPGGSDKMYEKLNAIHYDKPPYSSNYPQLAKILENHPSQPRGNEIVNNIIYGGKELKIDISQTIPITNHGNIILNSTGQIQILNNSELKQIQTRVPQIKILIL